MKLLFIKSYYRLFKEGKMIRDKIRRVVLVAFIIMTGGFSQTSFVLGQEKINPKPMETGLTSGWKACDPDLGEWSIPIRKQPVVGGVPMGIKRSEVTKLFTEKNILPQQRTVPMDIFPRLIGEISYIKKAYLFYTNERLSKLEILFNVPLGSKSSTGDHLFDFYGEIRRVLVKNYGQPTNTTSYVHPNFPYKLVALETGNAYFHDYWENADDMKILVSLKGKNEVTEFSVTYQYLPLFKEK